jgi:23S rRNA (uracil1939-C5)-methyltransferase
MTIKQHIVVNIERMASGGEAIGYLPASGPGRGKVVFVPYAAPGDRARVELSEDRTAYTRARLMGLEEASPERVSPPCPYFFQGTHHRKWCGGCGWQHLNYSYQLQTKGRLLGEALERIGRLRSPAVEKTLALGEPWRYRQKVQVPFRVLDGRPVFGFYASGSHDLVEFEDCLVQPEACTAVLKTFRQCALEWRWPAYDEDRGAGWLRHAALRINQRSEMLVTLVTRTPAFPEARVFCERLTSAHPNVLGIHQNINPERTNRIMGRDWKKLRGSEALLYDVGHLRLGVSPASFFQVNEAAARLLCETVKNFLGEKGNWDILLDLYCGVGLFGLFLADKAPQVIGIEEAPQAVRDARENQIRNRIRNARFQAASLERGLPVWLREECSGLRTAVVVDPPRTGLAPRLVRDLQAFRPNPLVYVSCDAATLARDLALLCQGPYVLQRVRPLDLFPQTPHIESVSLLSLRQHA